MEDQLTQRKFSEDDSINVFLQLLHAYEDIYKLNFIHRDVKPENILKQKDKWILADFGLCWKLNDPNEKVTEYAGTPFYLAPEIASGQQYDSKCDIWSLGVILYRMFHASFPFDCRTEQEYLEEVGKMDTELNISYDTDIRVRTKMLLKKMLTKNPQNRINWEELFKYRSI